MKVRLFFNTGDLIFRSAPEVFTDRTQEVWKKLGIPFQVVNVEDVARQYPSVRSDEDYVRVARPESGCRARAPRLRGGGRGIPSVWRRSPDGLCRTRRSKRRAVAEHQDDWTVCHAHGRHVRVCARALVSEGVSRSHGVTHTDAARPRPLFRHAAGQRSVHLPQHSELQFSRRDGLARAAARQSRIPRPPARLRADRSRYERPRLRSQPRRARPGFLAERFPQLARRRSSKRGRATTT